MSVVAKKILAYWVDNPHAKDTVDGIADWWVRYREFEYWRPRIKEALAELVERKLVLEKEGRDSQVYYELNRKCATSITRMIGRDRGK